MTQKKTKKPSHPKPISKLAVLKFAASSHAARPMIFWENAKIWDWSELLSDDNGNADRALLLDRLASLHVSFLDDEVTENLRSMVIIAKVTVPTRREFIRLCKKYGYTIPTSRADSP